MKTYIKSLITRLLWLQVKRLRDKHRPIVIAVAGSVGKTGTKQAIATVLSQQMKVAWQQGNYNDIISVPLIFFKQKMPTLYNPFGWLWVFLQSERQIQSSYPYQAVIVELGTDKPGDMAEFAEVMRADYGVLTAISPEHMANFADLDAVAKEELEIARLSDTLLIDGDAVDKKYRKEAVEALTYGQGPFDCRYTIKGLSEKLERSIVFTLKDGGTYSIKTSLIGVHSLPALAVAVLLADRLELKKSEIKAGLENIKSVPGRMQKLKGIRGALIIDDTYNASPEAVKAALDTLYEIKAKHKIAILGQMNELGEFSQELHEEIGNYCNPKQLDVVITIGKDANEYLAATAEKRGCQVMRCPSPDHAADVAQRLIQKDTVILAKGSQNGVFAEEAVKELLVNPADAKKLVRQSRSWLHKKQAQFSKLDR